jgi:lipopolysaccharide export system protein LptA
MNIFRILALLCLAAACSVVLAQPLQTKAFAAPPAPRARPQPTSASPSPSPTPGCDKQMKIGEVTLCSNEFNFNFKTGDMQFPQPLHGRTQDGTYRADRGYGNLHSQIINLIGHVVVHRDAKKDKAGKPVEALTLTADQTHIESKAKFYRASGNVKIVQGQMTMTAPLIVDDEAHRMINASGGVKIVKGDKTLTAPQIALDESTHIANLTGGVHAEQKPDRSFDSAQVLYNTVTEDFKAVGGVRMQFPANQPAPPPSPSPLPSASPGGKPTIAPAVKPTSSP